MKNILIFTTRQLCYFSGGYFAGQLANALENLGYCCEMYELSEKPTQEELDKMEQYLGQEFEAIIDFNSKVPRMVLDDGSYYLDHLKGPFYNYIVDNPLYHHVPLSCKLDNYHVVTLDENHSQYVKNYYPHIKSVTMLPLGATKDPYGKAFSEKEKQILFMGSYRDPDFFYKDIEQMQGKEKANRLEMIDMMLADSSLTMEAALHRLLEKSGEELTKDEFAERVNRFYYVEMYLRNYQRKRMMDALICAGIPVRIVGDWWDSYPYIDRKNVTWEQPVPFSLSFGRIASSAVLVDSSPFFKAGIHDRVFAGMANHTAVLTEVNPYKSRYSGLFETYQIDDLKELVYKSEELLINHVRRQSMVDKAFQEFEAEHTWGRTAQKLSAAWKRTDGNRK